MKKLFCILLVGLLLFATGCQEIVTEIEVSDDTPQTTDTTTVMEVTTTKTTTAKPVMKKTTAKPTTTTTTKNPVILDPTVLFYPFKDNTIVYHWIDADAFYHYLENPSEKNLLAGSYLCHTAIKAGNWLLYSNRSASAELVDLAGSKEALTAFLSEQGIQVNVQAAVLLELGRFLPLTILVKTDGQPVYITVDEIDGPKHYYTTNDDGEVIEVLHPDYIAYTHAEYCKKFGKRAGKITVDEEDVTEKVTVKLYYKTADISLFPALDAAGVTVEKLDEKTFEIRYQNKSRILQLYSDTGFAVYRQKNDRSWVFTGTYYKENGEFMVSDGRLGTLLKEMDKGWNVTVDMDAEAVVVN